MQAHTVTAVSATTTDDGLGNTSTTTTPTPISGVLYAPEGATESVATDSPALIGNGSLYGPFPPLDSDDTVKHEATCCSGAEFPLGDWQVVGGSRGWGASMVVVPIQRTAAV